MLISLIIISIIFDSILLGLYSIFADLNDNYHYRPKRRFNIYKILENIILFLIILMTSFICGLLIAGGIK